MKDHLDPREELVQHLPALRAFAVSLTRDSVAADDLVQDAVVKAWKNIGKFEPGTNLRAWLFTILRNTFYSDRRKARREVSDSDGLLAASLSEKPRHDGKLAFNNFLEAFQKLPDEQREALVLIGASGFSYEEAAETCGVAVGTIKSRVNRARAKLVELLDMKPGESLEMTDKATMTVISGGFSTSAIRQLTMLGIPRLLDGLAFRIALLLTIALVPIGLIAVSLTYRVAAEEERRNENAILALTAEAAASEENVMRAGQTVAASLASALPVVRPDQADCDALFKTFVTEGGPYIFAGYMNRDGIVTCASAGDGRDLSQSPIYKQMLQSPVPRIDARSLSMITGQSIIAISQPVFDKAGAFDGYIAVSLPNHRSFRNLELLSVSRPGELITFNDEGVVLSSEGDLKTVDDRLPKDRSLKSFIGRPRTAFSGINAAGEERVFAVVPIISNTVYALGSWPNREISGWLDRTSMSPLLFPLLMWLVSLGVAYLAVHRMAILNINRLRSRMRRFISGRRIERSKPSMGVPLEFREIDETFAEVAETVVREEAELENTIHSRTVLLKEVHHRVKNNLQLIASIVSMKIRKATSPEASAALKEVQMRVMSIATVHRALYTTSTVGRVQADELLESIVSKTVEVGVQHPDHVNVSTHYDPVSLYPDQAVPLSLLVSEAVTNALKYVGRPPNGTTPWIRISLRRKDSDSAEMRVENSLGTPLLPPDSIRGTGLGVNLIRAFSIQIRGKVDENGATDDAYAIGITFPIVDFEHEPQAELKLE